MGTVIIAIDGCGNVRKVFIDKPASERVLRGQGYHPHRNDGHRQNWYDMHDNFVCILYEWPVDN